MTRSLNLFGLIFLLVLLAVWATYFFLKKDLPKLYINELMASNSSCCPGILPDADKAHDWIEIYNGGSTAVDIGGMYLSQNVKKPLQYPIPKTHPELTTLQPGGFLLLLADGSSGEGVLHLDFKLDQDGEFIGLNNEEGRQIDTLSFGKQKENISFGRASDGAATWKEFSIPTPGKSNL